MPIVRSGCPSRVYWYGQYSACVLDGAIEAYIKSSIERIGLPVSVVFTQSDGFVYGDMDSGLGNDVVYNQLEKSKLPGTYPIVAVLCSRKMDRHNILHIPFDDDTFRLGLGNVLESVGKPAWEDRKDIVFWRGSPSGVVHPSIRRSVVASLIDHPHTDVRLTKWVGWEDGQNIPDGFFSDRADVEEHCKHKYIIIVDGNCVASSHQWVFGSGAVPIMITHPDNEYWFRRHLKPMVNYVPIKYDLSDLKEQIDWLVANDDKAKEIARNAMLLSDTIFTPEYQRSYIDGSIREILYGASSELQKGFLEKSRVPSDINEHLPTLYRYAKNCDSIVECGVRSITSSYAFAYGLVGNPKNSFTMIDTDRSENINPFLTMCANEGVNATFVCGSDTACDRIPTDLLFIDTWHVYAHLKQEFAYWHSFVRKYIILHDTTVDAEYGETIRCGLDAVAQSLSSGYPIEEIRRGLWPAVTEFLQEHPEWTLEHRYTNNNGLTVLRRV